MKHNGDKQQVCLSRRELLEVGLSTSLALCASEAGLSATEPQSKTLYNGIQLPTPWPPRPLEPTFEPMAIPYLKSPPTVIPIDVGRQLFVDDFLIEETTLKRVFHHAEYHPACPILRPDRGWEQEGGKPTAMVFSDGVWYDPKERVFKMWYMGGYNAATCYATSQDGIIWEKPSLDIYPNTNIVRKERRDSTTVWQDLEEPDPQRRYKIFTVAERYSTFCKMHIHASPDGIHWGQPLVTSSPCGDRSTVFWNPFRKVWVYSIRGDSSVGRDRRYWETSNTNLTTTWKAGEPGWWVGADRLDTARDDMKVTTQLYSLDAVAYESLMLGMFTIWHGQNDSRPKPNVVKLGFSRDGYHWHRPDRAAFLPVSERRADWNWGNVQSAGGGCLVVGDKLYFYCSGRTSSPEAPTLHTCTTGLATLRRDGFASMDAEAKGILTTRLLRFKGKHLFVNGAMLGGELRVECLDENGNPIELFTEKDCLPITTDGTRLEVRWKRAKDLARLSGRPIRLRFSLSRGSLYAFWVSSNASGASHGYMAGGGPSFIGPTDTVGDGTLAKKR